MNEPGFPNFLIIGAARSGTSSLYEYMKQHPDIYFSSNKEPMFFSFYQQKVDFKGPGDNLELNRKSVVDVLHLGFTKVTENTVTCSLVRTKNQFAPHCCRWFPWCDRAVLRLSWKAPADPSELC